MSKIEWETKCRGEYIGGSVEVGECAHFQQGGNDFFLNWHELKEILNKAKELGYVKED